MSLMVFQFGAIDCRYEKNKETERVIMWYLCNDAGDVLGIFENEDDAELALVCSSDCAACYVINADEYDGW